MITPTTLKFTPEECAEKYSAYFQHYPVEPSVAKMGEVFKNAFENNKRELRDFFSLDGEGRVLMAEYADISYASANAFPRMMNLFMNVTTQSQEEILSNAMKNGAKFSKYIINKYKDPLWDMKDYIDCAVKRDDFCLEFPRLPLAKRHDFETIVQNFYSELAQAKKMQMRMFFTVSPYDIVNASTGKVRSCNSIGGAHENAPICAMTSKHMAMFRLENETGELLGRCYVALSPDMRSFVVQPAYGYMKEGFIEDAKQWLMLQINHKLGDAAWHVYNGPTNIDPRIVSAEADQANFYVDGASAIMYRTDWKDTPAVRVGTSFCLVCGEPNLYICCAKCREQHTHSCVVCSQRCARSQELCYRCASSVKKCTVCGRYHNDLTQDKCGNCSTTLCACLLCGQELRIRKHTKGDGNNCTLLGGVIPVHTTCLDKKGRCPTCGGTTNFMGDCCVCAVKQNMTYTIQSGVDAVLKMKKKLSWDNPEVKLVDNPRLRLNYAMAA